MSEIHIEMIGDAELVEKLRKFPEQLEPAAEAAGREFGTEILETEGVQNYPPATSANQPPTPYYIRGRGTQVSAGYNDLRSEQYGTRWSLEAQGYRTELGNAASYAGHVGGVQQAAHLASKGWRRLVDAATEKMAVGVEIYTAWIVRALERAGLK